MDRQVEIRMMGEFLISVDEIREVSLVSKSRKGVALIEYLILNKGKQVPRQRLINTIWSGYLHSNPESALKTLVSRLRKMLNEICDGLGACIVSERGAYRWENLPGMKVDLLQIMDLFEELAREKDDHRRITLYNKLMRLYRGDMYMTGDIIGGAEYQTALHNEYLNAVYDYIELLMRQSEYQKIIEVCRKALLIDEFDDRLHIEMMQAQVSSGQLEEAMEQYRKVTDLNMQYLDAEPSEEIQAFYEKIVHSGNSLKFSLDSIRANLKEKTVKAGAYVCGYDEFKQLFNLMKPTLERLGCPIFLGLLMLDDLNETPEGAPSPERQKLMNSLIEILCVSLRRGDVVTKYTDTIIAVLLPTVNYTTGNMVMERVRHLFFERHPDVKVPFHYRLGELGSTDRL